MVPCDLGNHQHQQRGAADSRNQWVTSQKLLPSFKYSLCSKQNVSGWLWESANSCFCWCIPFLNQRLGIKPCGETSTGSLHVTVHTPDVLTRGVNKWLVYINMHTHTQERDQHCVRWSRSCRVRQMALIINGIIDPVSVMEGGTERERYGTADKPGHTHTVWATLNSWHKSIKSIQLLNLNVTKLFAIIPAPGKKSRLRWLNVFIRGNDSCHIDVLSFHACQISSILGADKTNIRKNEWKVLKTIHKCEIRTI